MNLVIDIGNTLTKLAWFDGGAIVDSLRLDKPSDRQLNRAISNRGIDAAMISSVGKSAPDLGLDLAVGPGKWIILNHKTPLPLQNAYRTPETLGHDRIAACVGAWELFPGHPVLVMDLGTAITIDFVHASGTYLGGNISPGLNTRFRALHAFTAKLPLANADDSFPALGSDTLSAIASGVQEGIVFELNGYMNDFMNSNPDGHCLITGGDAGFFLPRLKGSVSHQPDLVLMGLNHILEYNLSQAKP